METLLLEYNSDGKVDDPSPQFDSPLAAERKLQTCARHNALHLAK